MTTHELPRERSTTAGAFERPRFLSTLSHGLRTPLHNIFGYAQLLEAGIRGPLSPQQRTDIARIRENERDLVLLVDGVLNFARWYDKELPSLEDVRVRDALRETQRLVAASARTKGVTCDRNLKGVPAGMSVRAEPLRLAEILRQLFENAVKFSRPGAVITVRATLVGERVAVEIVDTGVGVDDADIAIIFDPFVRGRGSYACAQAGVGLGLAIAQTLARSINGELSVTSRRGKGSTFTLSLPGAGARPRVRSRRARNVKPARI